MLWFNNFILGSTSIFALLGLVMHNYNEFETRKIKLEPRIKLKHNKYIHADVLGLKGIKRLLGRGTVCIMQCSWA